MTADYIVDPDAIAVIDSVITVSDQSTSSHQVKYSLQGGLLSVICCYGFNNDQFTSPSGLAFNTNKLPCIVDWGNHRVQVFQDDDTFAFSFGNQFQYPVRIAVDSNNCVLVTDYDANCVHLR